MTHRLAAALLLTRATAGGREVFLVERSPELRFFGGYHALPGGTLATADGEVLDLDAALQQCALRELFEETGLLLHRLPPERRSAGALQEARQQLLLSERPPNGEPPPPSPWPALVHGCPPVHLEQLCRILTPPFVPVRYDTAFFHVDLADCSAGTGGSDGAPLPEVWPGELLGGAFWRPQDALQQWRQGRLRLVPPVIVLLEHLQAARDLDAFATAIGRTAAGYQRGDLHEVRFVPGIVLAPLLSPTLPPATTTNCYVVGHRQLWVVDPGSPRADEQRRLDELLRQLCRAPDTSLGGILATHHHPDHTGGIAALSRAFDLPVRGHPLTLPRLPAGCRLGAPLDDGDTIELGEAPDGTPDWRLSAIHTPGHDRGHLCFRDSRYGALLAGDMLSTMSTVIIDPPEGHLPSYLRSLERLLAGPLPMLMPAHGPPVHDGDKLVRKYLRHRRQREGSLLAALAAGGGTVEQLLPKVYWDADPALFRFAARSLLAGLHKLAEEGRAVDERGRWRLTGAAG